MAFFAALGARAFARRKAVGGIKGGGLFAFLKKPSSGVLSGRLKQKIARDLRRSLRLKVTTKMVDLGWRGIKKDYRVLHGSFVKVGFPFEGKTSGEKTMDEIIQIALGNEFGIASKNIPERPFVRTTIDENRKKIQAVITQKYNAIVSGILTPRQALDRIGEKVKDMMEAKVFRGPFAPLAATTVFKKGHDNALLDTRQMVRTIQHKLVMR